MAAAKAGRQRWNRAACGPQLALLRGRFDLSQSELAARVGIDEKTLRNWELQRTTPNASGRSLLALAFDALDVKWADSNIKDLAIGLGRREPDLSTPALPDRPSRWVPGVRVAAVVALLILMVLSYRSWTSDPLVVSDSTVDALPAVPVPRVLRPSGSHELRDTKILHEWEAVPGAIFYELQFCSTPPHTSGWDQIRMIKGTTATFDHQSRHNPIYWQVRAVDASGRRSDWARTHYFVD